MVPSSAHPLAECLEALYRVVVGVFGQILGPEFKNDTRKFEETLMGAMRTHNLRITPKVHVLVHHVPKYVRRIGVQLGPTSEQAPASQYRFLTQIQNELYKLPRLSRTFTECCITLLLVPFVNSILTFCALSSTFYVLHTDFENAHYSALHTLKRSACLANTNYHPRFF